VAFLFNDDSWLRPFITCTNQFGGLMYGDSIWLLASLGVLGSVLIQAGRVLAPTGTEEAIATLAVSDSLMAIYLWPMTAGYLLLGFTMSGYTLSGYNTEMGTDARVSDYAVSMFMAFT